MNRVIQHLNYLKKYADVESKNGNLEIVEKRQECIVGQRYYLKYEDLDTMFSLSNNKEAMDLISSYLKEIGEYTTIIENLGEGLYRDIVTDKIIVDDVERSNGYGYEQLAHRFVFDADLLKTDEKYSKLSREDREKIYYYYSLAELVYIDGLLDCILNSDEYESIKKYKEELNKNRVGMKYVIKYNDLELTLDNNIQSRFDVFFEKHLFNNLKTNYAGNNLTIIEYLGDGLYKDLSTNLLITERKVLPTFVSDNERINYNKLNDEDFVLKYPIRIDSMKLAPLTSEKLYIIGKKTLPNIAGINDCIEKALVDIELEYSKILSTLKNNELLRQQQEAEDLYEKDITISKAKKYYKIKKTLF